MQLHCQSMDCLLLWARQFVGALRYWSLKPLPSPLTFLLLETTSSLSGALCTKPAAFMDEGPTGLNKILGSIYIHSVIWEKTSLALRALSSYALALGREGFSQTSENVGPYLEARWMGSISHSGNSLSLSHSQEVIPAPPELTVETYCYMRQTGHSMQDIKPLRTSFPIYRGPGHLLI